MTCAYQQNPHEKKDLKSRMRDLYCQSPHIQDVAADNPGLSSK